MPRMIGRGRLRPPYATFVSSGAARATQMLEILRRRTVQDDTPILHRGGAAAVLEWRNRWRDAAEAAGKRADLKDIRAIDPENLVERESWLLGLALRQVGGGAAEGGRALVVGHSPTTEAAVARAPPAWLSRHWARAKGFCWSRTQGLPGWSRWTRSLTPGELGQLQ